MRGTHFLEAHPTEGELKATFSAPTSRRVTVLCPVAMRGHPATGVRTTVRVAAPTGAITSRPSTALDRATPALPTGPTTTCRAYRTVTCTSVCRKATVCSRLFCRCRHVVIDVSPLCTATVRTARSIKRTQHHVLFGGVCYQDAPIDRTYGH